ncbi:MAG: formylglycine-generating enzyme family protein, partial [Leptolyngbyaceae cyanobacterium MO_188.B28]|nr:formylglycine-generating enzyme family protein [Leptolyngbyaceae cyanobacterium MO_188.B28]
METSEQQRRSTIGQFAKALKDSKLEFDGRDLTDMLWLAQFIEPGSGLLSENVSNSSNTQAPRIETIQIPETPIDETTLDLYADDPTKLKTAPHPENRPTHKQKGMSFPVPAASALRIRLDLARALRPLMRKVPSRLRYDLDEDATVTQIAEMRVWMPMIRPRPERWLDLDLVVEASKTTVIWERVIAELQHLMEYQGAFRIVRTWRLVDQEQDIKLFPRWNQSSSEATQSAAMSQRPRSPRELVDPTGRRLVLFLTDCTSVLWRRGLIHATLWQWSEVQPVTIVQMLPERLWSRTALSDGHIVRLSSFLPGEANARLTVDGLSLLSDEYGLDELDELDDSDGRKTDTPYDFRLLKLPIVTLDFQAMRRWARMVAGVGDSRTPGRIFELEFVQQRATDTALIRSTSMRTAQQRVALFRSTASKTARQLANLMAATPVSLPVIDLLREEFRSEFQVEVQQSHVAEVLLSGLLRRCDSEEGEQCRYEFWGDDSSNKDERVRDVLLGDASLSNTIAVLNKLSEAITKKAGRGLKSFEALLFELQTSDVEWRDSVLPFAKIGLDVLRRLGGDYAALARRYDLNQLPPISVKEVDTDDFPIPPIQRLNFTTAQVVDTSPEAGADPDFPPLHVAKFQVATITLDSDPVGTPERFNFAAATLECKQTGLFRRRIEWVIKQRQVQGRRFVETLTNDILLEMIAIPGGIFLMGSPPDEANRSNSEGPQHRVRVSACFMGRYPITQAQWRYVANLPQVNRKLAPEPSHFTGDNRPVEQISWYEAVEFCDRLA